MSVANRKHDRRISASEFIKLAEHGDFAKLDYAIVEGEVSFRGMNIGHGLRFLYVTFLGPVSFVDAHIEGSVDLTGCHIIRTLDMSTAKITGNLILDEVVVTSELRYDLYDGTQAGYDWKYVDFQLRARAIEVGGHCRARFLSVVGATDFSGSHFGSNLTLRSAEIRGPLYLHGSSIENDLEITADNRNGELTPSSIHGSLELRSTYIKGNVFLSGMFVDGTVNTWSCKVEGNYFVTCYVYQEQSIQTAVYGNFHMGASKVSGHVEIAGARITGHLKLYSSHIGPLRLRRFLEKSADQSGQRIDILHECRIGSLQADGLAIEGGAELVNLQATGTGAGSEGTVVLSNANIKGDLSFWSMGATMHRDSRTVAIGENNEVLECEAHGANIVGNLDISNATVLGACDLTNISVDGTINLNDSSIHGDVTFQSDISIISDLATRERIPQLHSRLLQRIRAGSSAEALPKATARRLTLDMLSADNDVDLSGLVLLARSELQDTDKVCEIKSLSGYGSLTARGARIEGDLWLTRSIDDEKWKELGSDGTDTEKRPRAECEVPGSADFSDSSIGHLAITGSSFREPIAPEEKPERIVKERGVNLSNASIVHLEMRERRDESVPGKDLYPAPISLADTSIQRWNVADNENESNRREKYLSLLRSDPEFRRSTYLAVENSLRNQGHESDADAVYRSMMGGKSRHHRKTHRSTLIRNENSVTTCLLFLPVVVLLTAAFLTEPFSWIFANLRVIDTAEWASNFSNETIESDSTSHIWFTLAISAVVLLIIVFFSKRLLKILNWAFWGKLLGYGTAPLRPMIAILFLYAIATLGVYSNYINISPTLDAIEAGVIDCGDDKMLCNLETPGKSEWAWSDSFFIGIRNHVPLANWVARTEWELADTPQRPLYVFGLRNDTLRPEDFGILMMVLNFLLWPPFLTFALRRAFRYA